MRLEPLKEDNLYTGENPLEFILVPKCPFLGGFTAFTYHISHEHCVFYYLVMFVVVVVVVDFVILA